jgi:urease accessory protein
MKSALTIEAVLRQGRSVLADCYHTQPFKIMNVSGSQKGLELVLMSASPGLLEGDEQQLQLRIGAGAQLSLATQAYQRFFAMEQGATQSLTVFIEAGGSLVYLPHPAVPHTGARVRSTNTFHLSKGGALLWGEVLTCGRKGSGERFQFTSYRSTTVIHYAGRILCREVIAIEPAVMDLEAIGLYEGYSHQASFYCIDEKLSVASLVAALQPVLASGGEMLCGISALPAAGIVVRLLGQSAEPLYECLQELARSVRGLQAAKHKNQNEAYVG